MSLTKQIISPLYQTLNNGYDIEKLIDDSENYCEVDNKDLRVYLLGLTLIKDNDNQKNNLDNFYKYINSINDFTNIWSSFTIEMLGNKDFGIINYCKDFKDCEKAIQDIISLLEQYGDSIPESAARSAARSAESAWSAARSAEAAWSAWSAESAWSAVRSAESAARSAWSAARSAESAEFAWSAVRSAESAARSAESAARENMLNIYMGVLKDYMND